MKNFFEIRENMAMKMKLINKMKKASPAAKKALEAPSRVDKKKESVEEAKSGKSLDELSVKDVANQVMMKTKADAARKRRGKNVDQLKTSLDKLKKGLNTRMAPIKTPIKTRLNSQTEMSDMEKTRHMAATAGLKTKSPEQKRREREQQAKNRMNRPNPEMLGNSTHTEEKDPALKRAGVSGFNKPKRTPGHKSSSHIVVTKINGKPKTIRFGQQGASTAGDPKEGESDKMKAKRKSFKARHAKNIAKGKSSAAYWADKEKW